MEINEWEEGVVVGGSAFTHSGPFAALACVKDLVWEKIGLLYNCFLRQFFSGPHVSKNFIKTQKLFMIVECFLWEVCPLN